MADRPIRIAITAEEIHDLEPQMITAILDRGWDMVHLRHPRATLRDMRRLIEAVPMRLHGRLRLHGHFELLDSFNLGGIHLNRRCPAPPRLYSGPMSRSCHSAKEVMDSCGCDYVTLSPIFDSISKEGYESAFEKKDLVFLRQKDSRIVKTSVLALGGVTPERTRDVGNLGFDGYAVLGALMQADTLEELHRRLDRFETSPTES